MDKSGVRNRPKGSAPKEMSLNLRNPFPDLEPLIRTILGGQIVTNKYVLLQSLGFHPPGVEGAFSSPPGQPVLSPIHPSRNEYISKESLASQTTETVSTGNRISPVISCRRRKRLT